MAGAFWDGKRSVLSDLLRSAKASQDVNPTLKQAADGLGLSDHVLDTDQPSYFDMAGNAAVNTGHGATNLFNSLVRGLSPIGTSPEGNMALQVPPIIPESWDAITTPGRLLAGEPMTEEEIRRQASVVAGLAMTGGLVAPRSAAAHAMTSGGRIPAIAERVGDYGQSIYRSARYQNEGTRPHPQVMEFWEDRAKTADDLFAENTDDALGIMAGRRGQSGNDDFYTDPSYLSALMRQRRPDLQSIDGDLFSNGSREGAGVGMANALMQKEPKGITAYHGSPHDFDKFSAEHIGNGEGAQAFGHGLYFAESEGVAKSYKQASQWQKNLPNDPTAALATLRHMKTGGSLPANAVREIDDAIASIEAGKPALSDGHLYQVRINANPEDFLDWDKPLSGQSGKVRDTILPLLREQDRLPDSLLGKDAILSLQASKPGTFLDRSEVSPMLREAGIPGIRYLDQDSRASGAGSSNYVVFDDSLIDILKKYGWIPPAYAAGSGAFGPGEEEN